MERYPRNHQMLAIGLSAMAGYVDAVGFLEIGGFFVSFMSGNSTRLAVGAVTGTPSAAIAVGLIASFVAGVLAGTLLGHASVRHRTRNVLVLVGSLLAGAALLGRASDPILCACAMALAMGAENTAFVQDRDVLGVTYMTGTLTKLGQRLAWALLGQDKMLWLPYLFLWLGLIAGAAIGAAAFPMFGLNSLWLPAAGAFMLAGTIRPQPD